MPANFLGSSSAVDMTGLLTSTMQRLEKNGAYFDAISQKNPLFDRLKKNGNVKGVTGERAQVNLMYGLNDTFGAHKPYSQLPIDPQDGLGAAFFDWAEYHIAISIDGKTLRMNAGPEKIADLLDTKNKQAMITIANKFNQHLWDIENATTTTTFAPAVDPVTGGSQIIPIPLIVSGDDDVDASFGGINGLTYSWWRNQAVDYGASSSYQIFKNKMLQLWVECEAEGQGSPDLGICDKSTWLNFFSAIEPQRRYAESGDAGFGGRSVKFMSMDVFYDPFICDCDGTASGYNYDSASADTGAMYILNTNMLGLRYLKGANWAWQGFRKPVDQDAQANLCIWNGQLVCMNRRPHGILYGIDKTALSS